MSRRMLPTARSDMPPPARPARTPASGQLAPRTDPAEVEARSLADHVSGAQPQKAVAPSATVPVTPHRDPALAASADRGRNGDGEALPENLGRQMSQSFACDFSQVRVHADGRAASAADELDANAYTVGHDIVFGAGRYAPGTPSGRNLIAHELAHVAQQQAMGGGSGLVQREERDPDEVAAEGKEDAAIVARAKAALSSGDPSMRVHEIVWRLINNHRFDEHFELTGSTYEAKRKGIEVKLSGKDARTQGTIVAGEEVLKRLAAGKIADVLQEIQAQIGKVSKARGGVDYVFIMGADAPKSNNKFYTEAIAYFKAENPGATMFKDVRDLDGINKRINSEGKPVANLIIVSHAHPDGTLQFSLDPSDKTPRQVQYSELKEANEKGSLTQPDPKFVGFWTNVSIRGCNLGRSSDMLDEVRTAFGGDVRVIAPTHGQVFSGGRQSLAEPFYEESGKSKLSDDEAFKRMKAKPEYGFITDWDAMRKKMQRSVEGGTENVYTGEFPKRGEEMKLLVSQRGKDVAKFYSFGSATPAGRNTSFEFVSSDKFARGDITINQETPPTDAQAIAMARAKVANPDTYSFTVVRKWSGLNLTVDVKIEKTIWELHHAQIKKGGKGFNPSQGTAPWFGDTW